MNVNFDYFGKKVKITCKDGKTFFGRFTDDFEDEKKILIGMIELDYNDIKSMELSSGRYYYKESEIISNLKEYQANFLRNTDININTDIVELIDQLDDYLMEIGFDENYNITESGKITEEIIDYLCEEEYDHNLLRVIFVELDLDYNGKYYCFKSDLNDFQIGDEVVVETKYGEAEGIVREVAYYKNENMPYPWESLKQVKEIIHRIESDN